MTLTSDARAALVAAGQEHALERLDKLQAEDARNLTLQLQALDLKLLGELQALIGVQAGAQGKPEPPETFPLERDSQAEREAREAVDCGEALLAGGKLAYVLVAGGQASRLGYDAPKGAFPIGPVSGRSLFSIHAARLAAARKRFDQPMPWYVMTSPGNDQATRDFFREHDFFGLPVEDITFFSQAMQPALDAQGRVLFASKDSLFLAPNGHGGCLLALQTSGALADMRRRGIQYVSYFQVDNPLVRPTDPLFIGLHAGAGAGMSSKIVPKRDASEKVGVIGQIEGKLHCIEYSDMSREELESRNPDGKLTFRAGNIAVHMFSLDFLEQVSLGGDALPWHVASKQMAVVDAVGQTVSVPGFKFETFVFDALSSSPKSITLEVDRDLEFAPVKNKQGEDSPQTSRTALERMFAGWIRACGRTLPVARADGTYAVEVDPLLAETLAEFRAADPQPPQVQAGGHLYGA